MRNRIRQMSYGNPEIKYDFKIYIRLCIRNVLWNRGERGGGGGVTEYNLIQGGEEQKPRSRPHHLELGESDLDPPRNYQIGVERDIKMQTLIIKGRDTDLKPQ